MRTFGFLLSIAIAAEILGCGPETPTPIEPSPPAASTPPPKACTRDAKVCPDGVTSVGRTGPNCEFAPCPGAK